MIDEEQKLSWHSFLRHGAAYTCTLPSVSFQNWSYWFDCEGLQSQRGSRLVANSTKLRYEQDGFLSTVSVLSNSQHVGPIELIGPKLSKPGHRPTILVTIILIPVI